MKKKESNYFFSINMVAYLMSSLQKKKQKNSRDTI